MLSVALGMCRGFFEQSVVTKGAKLHVLGINFFMFMFLALFTANLAAILTQEAQISPVESFEEGLEAGYRFCIERIRYGLVSARYPSVPESQYVWDPVDGKVGFVDSGDASDAVARVFRRINVQKANEEDKDPNLSYKEKKYCHAGIGPLGDLMMEQAEGRGCDLVAVGPSVAPETAGFPIYDQKASILVPWLFGVMQNEGRLARVLEDAEPESKCNESFKSETSLSIRRMTGVWFVMGGFFVFGLIHTLVWRPLYVMIRRHNSRLAARVYKYDQHSRPIRTYQDDDDNDDNNNDDAAYPREEAHPKEEEEAPQPREGVGMNTSEETLEMQIRQARMHLQQLMVLSEARDKEAPTGRRASQMTPFASMLEEDEGSEDGHLDELPKSNAGNESESSLDLLDIGAESRAQ
eukprot:CAMPEP_0116830410 /NCGR_PEP_ID=MMETSP0418-20121206/4747_1 /TAXON_ID=1158023 /ORGANISM="Astrosyne radiata, Strain 13vi08-1A" /LENGTH=407 /DNA_ID=CAMNT_0004459509 /DNA_START=256 /DNA_END=1479 /DNA_ORIENTATION=-